MFDLRAGILIAPDVCPHCSRPTAGGQACGCGDPSDPRGPRSFAAQV